MRTMVVVVPQLSGYGMVRRMYVSLPYVPGLVDGQKYMLPDQVPERESRDLRRMRQRPTMPCNPDQRPARSRQDRQAAAQFDKLLDRVSLD